MFPSTNQMLQVGASPYSISLPPGAPFLGMIASPWNPTLPVQLGLVLTQILTSQPIPTMP